MKETKRVLGDTQSLKKTNIRFSSKFHSSLFRLRNSSFQRQKRIDVVFSFKTINSLNWEK